MIGIQDLRPSDISLILGIWEAILGGNSTIHMSRNHAEQWCAELRSGQHVGPIMMSSRWHMDCDLTLVINPQDGLAALAYEAVCDATLEGREAKSEAKRFVSKVASL